MAALPPPLSKLSTNSSYAHYDDHTRPHQVTTVPQLTLFVVWVAAVVLWVMRCASKANLLPRLWAVPSDPGAVQTVAAEDRVATKLLSDGLVAVTVNGAVPTNGSVNPPTDGEAGSGQAAVTGGSEGSTTQRRTITNSTTTNTSGGGTTTNEVTTTTTKQNFSAILPPPTLDQFLQQIIILGVIMIYFYLCDYRKVSTRCCSSLCIEYFFSYLYSEQYREHSIILNIVSGWHCSMYHSSTQARCQPADDGAIFYLFSGFPFPVELRAKEPEAYHNL